MNTRNIGICPRPAAQKELAEKLDYNLLLT